MGTEKRATAAAMESAYVRINNPPSRGADRSSLDELRPIGAGLLVFLQDTEPPRDFGIRLDQPAEIAAETILVELVVRSDVPQAAGIGGNLIGDDDAHYIAFPQPAAFHLEIDKPYADAKEKPG